MTLVSADSYLDYDNPIDCIEEIVTINDWPFDRISNDELSVCISGVWIDYQICFTYLEDRNALQIIVGFDVRVKPEKRPEIYELMGRINEHLMLGHFELWEGDSVPIYRNTQFMGHANELPSHQLQTMIEAAVNECERFYPAFQFNIWGGKSPEEAITACILETVGEA